LAQSISMKKTFDFKNKEYLDLLKKFTLKEKKLIKQYLNRDFDDLYWTCLQEGEDFYQPVKDLVLNMDDENYNCPFFNEDDYYSLEAEDLILFICNYLENEFKNETKLFKNKN